MSTASSQHDPHLATPAGKPRARAVGLKYRGIPGPHNAITDVPGIEVGYQTLIEGDSIRTGVTAIHPRGKHNPGDPVAAGYFSLNGNGEMTGVTWIEESGDPMSSVSARADSGEESYDSLTFVPWARINPFFEAVVQATEEAVANALIANEDMTGRDGRRVPALPRKRLREILAGAHRR